MQTDSEFGKALFTRMEKKGKFFTRRQKDILASVDVARAVLDILSMPGVVHPKQQNVVKGNCMIIIRARNNKFAIRDIDRSISFDAFNAPSCPAT